jgi:hypothetical protein
MDQFGWTESEAILYMGILLASGGVIVVICFWSVGPLSKRQEINYETTAIKTTFGMRDSTGKVLLHPTNACANQYASSAFQNAVNFHFVTLIFLSVLTSAN